MGFCRYFVPILVLATACAIHPNEIMQPDAVVPETADQPDVSAKQAQPVEHPEVSAKQAQPAVSTTIPGCPFGFSHPTPETPCENDALAEAEDLEQEGYGTDRVRKLTNDDFNKGTYRIKSPGTYKLMEDIVFCPLSEGVGDVHYQIQPNSNVNDHKCTDTMRVAYPGMPIDESSSKDLVRGSQCNGPYHMGFFAAITVESTKAQKVVIDLNGHRIDMCHQFYLAQRFYAHIELNSVPFIPTSKKDYTSQGPTFFGSYDKPAHHVLIKNGVLGKSSHHGIHGNTDGLVTIEDLKIEQFEVGGIQLNGPSQATIKNVDIGPSSTTVPVLAAYSQARFLMPYLIEALHFTDQAGQKGADYALQLNGQSITFGKVVQTLKNAMITQSVHEHGECEVFKNPTGLPDGSAVYGIVIHKMGAAAGVFADAKQLSKKDEFAGTVSLSNVNIHDLKLKAIEIKALGFGEAGGSPKKLVDPVGAILNFKKTGSTSTYADNSNELLDAQTALAVFIKAHSKFQIRYQTKGDLQNTHPEYLAWAAAGNQPLSDISVDRIVCGGDAMHHVNKGAVGLRAEFVKSLSLDKVRVDNVHNFGEFDYRICDNVVDSRHSVAGFMAPDSRGAAFYAATLKTYDMEVSGVNSEGGSAIGVQDFGHTTFPEGVEVSVPKGTSSAVKGPIHSQKCVTATKSSLSESHPCEALRTMEGCVARKDCKVHKADVLVRQCSVQGELLEAKLGTKCSVKTFEIQEIKEQ